MADALPLRAAASDPPSDTAGSSLVVDARRLAPMLCCAVRTLRSWDATGRLPAPLRIGGRVVWSVEEIEAWIRAGCPRRKEWEARKAALEGKR